MTLFYKTFPSPIGIITIAADATHLQQLHIEGDRYFSAIPQNWQYKPRHAVLQQAEEELAEYFKGRRLSFSVPVASNPGTAFQKAVWQELQNIKAGHVLTYSELAARIGRPKAVRAVGTAVGHNPLCIIIPCHRIVASNGSLGGYVAGLHCKQYLLKHEETFSPPS